MIYTNKRKREKEVGLRDILQELKKQTYLNYMLSSIVILFTVAILFYEMSKKYFVSIVVGAFISIFIFIVLQILLHRKAKQAG